MNFKGASYRQSPSKKYYLSKYSSNKQRKKKLRLLGNIINSTGGPEQASLCFASWHYKPKSQKAVEEVFVGGEMN